MHPNKIRSACELLLGVCAATCGTQAANSQTIDTPTVGTGDARVEEVTVTAQRRSENLQSVPIAISTISGEGLTNSGIRNTQDLMTSIPALDVNTSVGNTQLFVRGVGTTAAAVENDVGVYVDGVYIASQSASLLNLNNIDHVEVLKGPQGTLFGRNSIGGVLQIVTKDPSTTPAANVSLGYANYDTVTGSFYGTTGVAENLASDLSLYYNRQFQGWGTNFTTGKSLFEGHSVAVRNKWLFEPTDDTKVTFSVDYSRDVNELGLNWRVLPGGLGLDGVTTHPGFYNTVGDHDDSTTAKQYGAMLRLEQDFGWARGVSITSYRRSDLVTYDDHDVTPVDFVNIGPAGLYGRTLSAELQLLSLPTSTVQWIGGFYYLDDDFGTRGFRINVGLTLPGGQFLPDAIQQTLDVAEPTKSYAGFGQATVEVLPETKLTLGLRYTKDKKSVTAMTYLDGPAFGGAPPPPVPADQENDFSKLTYRVVLDHQFTPDVLGYVSYDTGFKSGQYNLPTPNAPAVDPEKLTAYQAGVKTEFLDHRLRVNVAPFYYEFSNIQIYSVQGNTALLLNAASATLYGVDIDVDARVSNAFTVKGAVSLLHGRYGRYSNAPSYVPAPTGGNRQIAIDATDNTTVHSPEVAANLAGDYRVQLAASTLDLNVNVSYNSGYYWDVDNRLKQPSLTLLGAFVTWKPNGSNWDVRLWGNNLTGKKYYAYETAYSDGDVGSPAAPATYGVAYSLAF